MLRIANNLTRVSSEKFHMEIARGNPAYNIKFNYYKRIWCYIELLRPDKGRKSAEPPRTFDSILLDIALTRLYFCATYYAGMKLDMTSRLLLPPIFIPEASWKVPSWIRPESVACNEPRYE